MNIENLLDVGNSRSNRFFFIALGLTWDVFVKCLIVWYISLFFLYDNYILNNSIDFFNMKSL